MNQDNERDGVVNATTRLMKSRNTEKPETPFWKDHNLWHVVVIMLVAVLFLWRVAVVSKEGIDRNGHRYISPVIGQWVHDPDCPHESHHER